MIGNETAVSNVSILPIPSMPTVNLAPKLGSQAASYCKQLGLVQQQTATTATAKVSMDDSNAQFFAAFSPFNEKEIRPVIKGSNMSNKGTI
jgi:hypothetical protein